MLLTMGLLSLRLEQYTEVRDMINEREHVRNLMCRMSREDAESSRRYMRGLMNCDGAATIARNVQSLILWKVAIRKTNGRHEIY